MVLYLICWRIHNSISHAADVTAPLLRKALIGALRTWILFLSLNCFEHFIYV